MILFGQSQVVAVAGRPAARATLAPMLRPVRAARFSSHLTLASSIVGHLDEASIVTEEDGGVAVRLTGWAFCLSTGRNDGIRVVFGGDAQQKENLSTVQRHDVAQAYEKENIASCCGWNQLVRLSGDATTTTTTTTCCCLLEMKTTDNLGREAWIHFMNITWKRSSLVTTTAAAAAVASSCSSSTPSLFLDLARYDRVELRKQFLAAEPFNHLVIDNFLDADLMVQAERDLRAMPKAQWHDHGSPDAAVNDQGDTCMQTKKVALVNPDRMPPKVRQAMAELQGAAFIQFLSDVTGIEEPLQVDPSQFGAGVHRVQQGGHLTLHADFNVHHASGKYRRLNALIYLNSDWAPAHQGQLELWSKTRCVHSLPPIFNRLVLFRITDDAIHGHPRPWLAPKGDRLSFALYYYTDDRPAHEKTAVHYGAQWYP